MFFCLSVLPRWLVFLASGLVPLRTCHMPAPPHTLTWDISHHKEVFQKHHMLGMKNKQLFLYLPWSILVFRSWLVWKPSVLSNTWRGVRWTQCSHYTTASCSTRYLSGFLELVSEPGLLTFSHLWWVVNVSSVFPMSSNSLLWSGFVWHNRTSLPVGAHGDHIHPKPGCAGNCWFRRG